MVGGEAEAVRHRPGRQGLHAGHPVVGAPRRRGAPVGFGDRVKVEAVDGLTLVVRPVATPAGQTQDIQPGSSTNIKGAS